MCSRDLSSEAVVEDHYVRVRIALWLIRPEIAGKGCGCDAGGSRKGGCSCDKRSAIEASTGRSILRSWLGEVHNAMKLKSAHDVLLSLPKGRWPHVGIEHTR